MVRTIYQQPSPQEVHSQFEKVVEQLAERFPQASSMLAEDGADVLVFTGFPGAHWKQVWSNNPQERLNKEIRRRTDVVGIFPNRPAVRRLIGAVLAVTRQPFLPVASVVFAAFAPCLTVNFASVWLRQPVVDATTC